MTREEAEKELIAMLQEAEGGPSYSMGEVDAYMRELLHPKNQIYLTGDTHGRFERIISFCERQQVQSESTFIILGDVGLNYYGDRRDRRGKDALAQIPITFFCIHGNHEMRPSEELGYARKTFGMFTGEEVKVHLRFENHLVGAVLDRLGRDVLLVPDGEDHFTVWTDVIVSPQFFAWLCGFQTAAKVIGPDDVVKQMAEHVKSIAAQYE